MNMKDLEARKKIVESMIKDYQKELANIQEKIIDSFDFEPGDVYRLGNGLEVSIIATGYALNGDKQTGKYAFGGNTGMRNVQNSCFNFLFNDTPKPYKDMKEFLMDRKAVKIGTLVFKSL